MWRKKLDKNDTCLHPISLKVQNEQFSEEKGFILRDTEKEI